MSAGTELGRHIEGVARLLLGEPNRTLSTKANLRFGRHGSMSIDLEKGTWFSNEEKVGGGVVDLIARQTGRPRAEAFEWLRSNGFEVPQEGPPQPAPKFKATDTWLPPGVPETARAVAHFDYLDAGGKLVLQVVRYEWKLDKPPFYDKTFRQRRPDPKNAGRWIWSVKDIALVPYRLAELTEAVAQDCVVFVVEGEKCVEALAAEGVPATCNPMGAGKWPANFAEFFKGADVVILPDNDDPGRAHRDLVASALAPIAKRVRVLDLPDLPEKGDVADWLKGGGDAQRLYGLLKQAREWGKDEFVSRFQAVAWTDLDKPGPEHEWLVKNVLTRKERSMLVGESQSGKSFFAVDISLAVARGVDFFGCKTLRGGVIYQAGEGGRGIKKRLRAYRQHHGLHPSAPLPFVLLPSPVDLFANDDHTNQLIAEIKHWAGTFDCPLELVVIDTLAASTPGANENASEDMSRVLQRCERIATECDTSVMLVHHMNAAGEKPRGHTSIFANLDNVLLVQKMPETDADNRPIRMAKTVKQKDGQDNKRFRFVLKQEKLGIDKDGEDITSCVVKDVNDKLDTAPKDAFDFRGPNARLIFAALLTALRQNGVVPPVGTGAPRGALAVDVQLWREAFRRTAPIDADEDEPKRAERVKRALTRATADFQSWGLIGINAPWVWLTGRPVRGFDIHSLINSPPTPHYADGDNSIEL